MAHPFPRRWRPHWKRPTIHDPFSLGLSVPASSPSEGPSTAIEAGVLEGLDGVPVVRATMREFAIPLQHGLLLAGHLRIEDRRYVVLELTLANGLVGTSYVLTRGRPIFSALKRTAATSVIGRSLGDLLRAPMPHDGLLPELAIRVRSLIDVCGWDLYGQSRNLPLWRCIAESATPQEVLLVDGYRHPGESGQAFAHRLRLTAERGIQRIKVAADLDVEFMHAALAELRKTGPEDLELVVDMEQAWPTVEGAVTTAQGWEPYRLCWVEDPLVPSRPLEIREIRSQLETRLGAGDEASLDELKHLVYLDATDVLRVDAMTAGGVTGALEIARLAAPKLSFHVYPELHRHLVFGLGTDEGIEMFPEGSPFDFIDRLFVAEDLKPDEDGCLSPPTTPGVGLTIRPGCERFCVGLATIDQGAL